MPINTHLQNLRFTGKQPNASVFVIEIQPTGISRFRHQGSYPVGIPVDTVIKRIYDEGLVGPGTYFVGEIASRPITHPFGQLFTISEDGNITAGLPQASGLLTSWPPKKR